MPLENIQIAHAVCDMCSAENVKEQCLQFCKNLDPDFYFGKSYPSNHELFVKLKEYRKQFERECFIVSDCDGSVDIILCKEHLTKYVQKMQ